jgi:uncharacterized protein
LRIFLDTNVLISAFATRGLCADLFRHVLAEHELVVSEVVLEETRRVLRKKLGLPETRIREIDSLLRQYCVESAPLTLPRVEIRDRADALVLGSALAVQAEVLVTGDRDLLEVRGQVSALAIVDPRTLWNLIRQKNPGSR